MRGEREMKNRKLSALLVAAMVSAMVVLPASATETEGKMPSVGYVDGIEIMPRDMYVKEDTINDPDGLDLTRALNRSNGKYVNFYIENLGENPVVATINGQKERTFEPGEKGHINFEVTQGIFGGDKNYTFKAVAGKDGGTVHIHYIIYQRDVQS